MRMAWKVLFLSTLIGVVVLLAVPTIATADELTWETTDVHFDGDVLVIHGNFTNHTDEVVDRINSFGATVKLKRHDDWHEVASRTFDSFDLFLKPGESHQHTFRMHDVEKRHFDDFKVRWRVSYHWHKHHHDEYHEHHNDW